MLTTRDRALAAAVELVGVHGVRALTHVRVDVHAGLPKGSTSNWFRTREALVTGVLVWIAEQERAELVAAMLSAHAAADVVGVLARLVGDATGRHAVRTRARYALFFETSALETGGSETSTSETSPSETSTSETSTSETSTSEISTNPQAQKPIRTQRALFEEWMRGLLFTLGAPDPAATARTLLALCAGIIVNRLTVDPDIPIRPAIEQTLRGCLHA